MNGNFKRVKFWVFYWKHIWYHFAWKFCRTEIPFELKYCATYWNVSYRIPRSHCETQMYLKQKCCEHFSNVLNIITVTQAIAVRQRYCLKLKCCEHFSNVLNIITVTQAIAVRPRYCLKLKCWKHFSNVLNIVTVTQAIAVRPTYDSV